jgi:hypothetical protein
MPFVDLATRPSADERQINVAVASQVRAPRACAELRKYSTEKKATCKKVTEAVKDLPACVDVFIAPPP